jgi:hypothetical protein
MMVKLYRIGTWYKDYTVDGWNQLQYGYVNRGWCRLEMFYASNMPLDITESKLKKLKYGLLHHLSQGVRPHLLFGTSELQNLRQPVILPPLQNAFYEQLDPVKGHLTNEAHDRPKIEKLVEGLKNYMQFIKEGYEGETDTKGQKHGKGIFR